MTGSELLARATRALNAAQVPDAGRDARRLLAHVLRVPAGRLTLFLPEPVAPDLEVVYNVLIERRCERVPVSHLTGRRLFYGREFFVTPDVLDPRPETETLVEAALGGAFTRVLDLGTGSGCILMTLLAEREEASGLGIELSGEALGVAQWNRNTFGLGDRCDLLQGNWFTPLLTSDMRFDLIVSNPPYIAAEELDDLAPEVRDWEPEAALTDGADGLEAYRAICRDVARFLLPGGRFMVEIGPTQAAAVSQIIVAAGLEVTAVIPDMDLRDRVVAARAANG